MSEKHKEPHVDLTGNKFGSLLVIGPDKQQPGYWLCKCSCGKTCVVLDELLTSGERINCGHATENMYIGNTYCGWTVLQLLGRAKYRCECETCKAIGEFTIKNLKLGKVEKCNHARLINSPNANKDIRLQQFGNLTAIQLNRMTDKWYCMCACGNHVHVNIEDLLSGKVTKCSPTCTAIQYENLTGREFGRLTALSSVNKKVDNMPVWKCSCKCGNVIHVKYDELVNGKVKNCGCINGGVLDIIGQRFGNLTAMQYVGKSQWVCRCDCGNSITVNGTNLRTGKVKHCGCLKG